MAGDYDNAFFPHGFFPDRFWPDGFWPKPPGAALQHIEQAIYRLFAADAALIALIGTRLYPVYLPQTERKAAVVYQQLAETESLTVDGATGLIKARFQFTCWAPSHAAVLSVARALGTLLADYSGDLKGITIAHTRILGRGDIPAMDEKAEQAGRYGKYIDVRINYSKDAA